MQSDWEIGWKDYYQILGIKQNANSEEINKAYKFLVKKTHPDKFVDNEKEHATKKFQILHEAHRNLSNPVNREKYDIEWIKRNNYKDRTIEQIINIKSPFETKHDDAGTNRSSASSWRSPFASAKGSSNWAPSFIRFIFYSSIILVSVYVILHSGDQLQGSKYYDGDGPKLPDLSDVPSPYYLSNNRADAHNPDELIRYGNLIKDYATNLDSFERVAFFEWFFKSQGLEGITFAYTSDFRGEGDSHLWLLMRTPKGEIIKVEPNYREMGVTSLLPSNPGYRIYEKEFPDIYEACKYLGTDRLDWWKDKKAQQVMQDSQMLTNKKEAMTNL